MPHSSIRPSPAREPVARKAAAKLERPAFQQQKTMKALVWHKPQKVAIEEVPRPTLGSAGDVILKVTAATICGSDLHHYHNAMPAMMDGDIMGHEFMGIVEEVGPAVEKVKVGDRVVVSCVIACGECEYCLEGNTSFCDTTNPNPAVAALWGQSLAATYGYTHFMGGYAGGHAQYVRVPFADFNTLHVPPSMTDEQAVALSDTWCTGWMAADYAQAGKRSKTIAVWGLGPIGLTAMEAARTMGATDFIAIDHVPERLALAKSRFGAEVLDAKDDNVVERVMELTHRRGPDACIDATGFRYAKKIGHQLQRAGGLETDSIEALSEAIKCCRKGGIVVPIADYVGYANKFPIGAVMEKGLKVQSSQIHVHKYWKTVMAEIQAGRYDPTFTLTHTVPLEKAPEMYERWDEKKDGIIKVMLRP